MKLFLSLFVVIAAARAAHLPTGVPTCSQSDTNFEKCVSDAITGSFTTFSKGVKALGLTKLDPLFVKSIHINGNGGRVDLQQTFEDLDVIGLSKIKFMNYRHNLNDDNCNIHYETFNPNVQLIGNYKMKGQLLLFTLNGHGKNNITLSELKTIHDLTCKKLTKNGKEFLEITEYKLDLQPAAISFDFQNIIDKNAELSAEVSKVVNESGLEVFQEVKKDYDATFGEIFKSLAGQVYGKVPLDEIYPK